MFRSSLDQREIREERRVLMGRFIDEQIEQEQGLSIPTEIQTELKQLHVFGYANQDWAQAGREIRGYADEFGRSKERENIRGRASQVTRNISSVTEDRFRALLSELLDDGITKERIIALFFFCSDVAIEVLRKEVQSDIIQRLIHWLFDFIFERVCTWVQAHGGWGGVFTSTAAVFGRRAIPIGIGIGVVLLGCYAFKTFT